MLIKQVGEVNAVRSYQLCGESIDILIGIMDFVFSKLLIDVGAAAYKAAQAKDLNAVLALNEQLNTACVTCHEQYRPNYRKRLPPKQ